MSSPVDPGTPDPGTSADAAPAQSPGGRLTRNIAVYTLLRLVLFVVVVAAIVGLGELVGARIPVLVAGIIGLIIALPLSMVLFTRLRRTINEDIAAVDSGRRTRREELRRRMAES